MIQHLAKTSRRAACGIALLLAPAWPLVAQTNDDARLTLGISIGYIGGQKLWDVPSQSIASVFDSPDIFHLHREIHSDFTISGHGTYFRGPHIGFTGEFTYAGLGNLDACNVIQDSGDLELVAACNALQGSEASASTTFVQGGLVIRPFARSLLQPYFKGLVGLAFTPSSTIAMESIYGAIADTNLVLTIYKDDNWKEIRATWTAAIGVSTAPSSGYQLHIEARESWLPLGVVTGPTSGQGFMPPNKSVLKGFTSVLIGFDIVLEKRRGRRY